MDVSNRSAKRAARRRLKKHVKLDDYFAPDPEAPAISAPVVGEIHGVQITRRSSTPGKLEKQLVYPSRSPDAVTEATNLEALETLPFEDFSLNEAFVELEQIINTDTPTVAPEPTESTTIVQHEEHGRIAGLSATRPDVLYSPSEPKMARTDNVERPADPTNSIDKRDDAKMQESSSRTAASLKVYEELIELRGEVLSNKTMSDKLSLAERSIDAQKIQLDLQQSHIEEAQERSETCFMNLEALQQESQTTTQALTLLKNKMEANHAEVISAGSQRVDTIEKHLDDLKKSRIQLQRTQQAARATLTDHEVQLQKRATNVQWNDLDSKYKDLQVRHAALQTKFETAVSHREKELNDLRADSMTMKEQLQATKSKCAQLEALMERRFEEFAATSNAHLQHKTQLDKLETRFNLMQARHTSSFEAMKEELLEQQHKVAETHSARLKRVTDKIVADMQSLKSQTRGQITQKQLDDLESKFTVMLVEQIESQEEIKESQEKTKRFLRQHQDQATAQQHERFEKTLDTLNAKLLDEGQVLQTRLETSLNDLHFKIGSLQSKQSEIQRANQSQLMERQDESTKTQYERFKALNDALEVKLQAKLTDYESLLQDRATTQQLEQLDNKYNSMQSKQSEPQEEIKNYLVERQDRIAQTQYERFQEMKDALEARLQDYEVQLQDRVTTKQLDRLNAKYDSVQSKQSEPQDVIKHHLMESQDEVAKSQYERFQEMKNAFEEKLQDFQVQLQDRITRRQLDELESKYDTMQSKLSDPQDNITKSFMEHQTQLAQTQYERFEEKIKALEENLLMKTRLDDHMQALQAGTANAQSVAGGNEKCAQQETFAASVEHAVSSTNNAIMSQEIRGSPVVNDSCPTAESAESQLDARRNDQHNSRASPSASAESLLLHANTENPSGQVASSSVRNSSPIVPATKSTGDSSATQVKFGLDPIVDPSTFDLDFQLEEEPEESMDYTEFREPSVDNEELDSRAREHHPTLANMPSPSEHSVQGVNSEIETPEHIVAELAHPRSESSSQRQKEKHDRKFTPLSADTRFRAVPTSILASERKVKTSKKSSSTRSQSGNGSGSIRERPRENREVDVSASQGSSSRQVLPRNAAKQSNRCTTCIDTKKYCNGEPLCEECKTYYLGHRLPAQYCNYPFVRKGHSGKITPADYVEIAPSESDDATLAALQLKRNARFWRASTEADFPNLDDRMENVLKDATSIIDSVKRAPRSRKRSILSDDATASSSPGSKRPRRSLRKSSLNPGLKVRNLQNLFVSSDSDSGDRSNDYKHDCRDTHSQDDNDDDSDHDSGRGVHHDQTGAMREYLKQIKKEMATSSSHTQLQLPSTPEGDVVQGTFDEESMEGTPERRSVHATPGTHKRHDRGPSMTETHAESIRSGSSSRASSSVESEIEFTMPKTFPEAHHPVSSNSRGTFRPSMPNFD